MNTPVDSVAVTLALRYLKTRKRKFAAFITWVSVTGLTLGVLVLTAVISVMNGFDFELKSRILGTVPHIVIADRAMGEVVPTGVTEMEGVADAYDFFVGSAMVTRNSAVNPVTIYGIDPASDVALRQLRKHMIRGSLADLDQPGRGIILGAPLAAYLGLLPGDNVAVIMSVPGKSGLQPRMLNHRLVGTFEIGHDLDLNLAIVELSDLATLTGSGTLGVRLSLVNPLLAAGIASQLAIDHPDWDVRSWSDSYGELFDAVRLEKVMMFLILLLVVAVAAFNIVSGQMMVVTDKRSDIAILRTIGASTQTILQTFLLQGLIVSTLGIAIGLVLGVIAAHWITEIVAIMKTWFGFALLEGTYFVEVPSVVKSSDLWVIGLLSWGLCLASAWLPAHRAAQLNPVDGLHG